MGLPVENTDRLQTATDLLIDIFQSKSNFVKLLSSYAQETQEIESMLMNMLDSFYIANAVGDQLDSVGEVVGASRQGADDDTFRIRIRVRIKLNLTSGTPNQILEIVGLLLPLATPLYVPYFPATFEVSVIGDALTELEARETGNAVIEATPAGVRGSLRYGLSDENNLFRFSASGTTETGATTKGFSDLSQITGGKLSGVIANG